MVLLSFGSPEKSWLILILTSSGGEEENLTFFVQGRFFYWQLLNSIIYSHLRCLLYGTRPCPPATYYTTCIFWWFMHLHFPPMMRREKNAHTVWAVMNSWSSAFVHHRRSWGVFRSTKACLKGQSADDSKESKKVFSSSNTEEDMKCTFF